MESVKKESMGNWNSVVAMAAMEATVRGITICDATKPDLPLIYVNNAFCELTGYSAKEVIGKNCRFLQNNDRAQSSLRDIKSALLNKQHVRATLRNYKKDGTMFWNELSISPVINRDGRLTHFVGVQNDVSHSIDLKQQRDDFVATLVHDLKNPLMANMRIFDLLELGLGSEQDRTQMVGLLRQTTQSMLRLTLNALEHYRLEDGALHPLLKPVDLVELSRQILEEFSLDLLGRKVVLKSDLEHSIVAADETLIGRVLANMIDNALKYSDGKGPNCLRIQSDPSRESITVTMSNSANISHEQLRGIFHKFSKRGARNKYGSTGLGLYICRKLISAHKGNVFATSNDGTVTVGFTLPTLNSHVA